MPLSAGTKLGPYEILAPIGAGGPTFTAGGPVALFEGVELVDLAVDRTVTYWPAADGQRFLVSAAAGGDAAVATPLTVVTNWIAGFKK